MSAGSIARLCVGAPKYVSRLSKSIRLQRMTVPKVALEVTRGIHKGGMLALAEQLYTFGSSTESHIVLSDSGIASVHARLRRYGNRVEIEAVGGDVILADGAKVPKGHGRRCTLPVRASLGEAQILLTRPQTTETDSRKRFLVAAGLVLSVFALSMAANSLSLAEPDRSEPRKKTTKIASLDGMQRPRSGDGTSGPGVSSAAQGVAEKTDFEGELRQRLAQAGLEALVVQNNNGQLTVTGRVPQSQNEAWTGIRAWFDKTYGAHALLVANVTTGDVVQAPHLKLQAIWYGQRPYIVSADGARYYEGAFTDDGWMIKRIGETELLLAKGDTTVALKYP